MKKTFTQPLLKYSLLLIFILLSFDNLWSQSISTATNGTNISIMNTTIAPGSGTWTTLSTITVSETVAGQIQTGTYTVSLPAGWQFDTSQNILISTSAGNIAFANASITPSSAAFQFTVITVSSVASSFNFTLIKVRPTISTTSGIQNMVVSAPNIAFPLHGSALAQLSTISGPHNAYIISGGGVATAGLVHAAALRMADVFGNTVTSFTGDKTLTFSGLSIGLNKLNPTITNKAGVPSNFMLPIAITFTNGVMTAGGNILPYKAETKIISCTDGTYTSSGTGGSTYSLIVNTAPHTLFTFSSILGATHNAPFTVTITATDACLNPILGYTGTPTITVTGTPGSTISPVNPLVTAAFTAGVSVPAVNVTLLGIGSLKTLTATDGGATGTSNTFSVFPAELSIIPNAGQTKVFGNANPGAYNYTCSPALLGGETITGAMGRATGENAGTYEYTLGTLVSANYTIKMTGTPVSFSITPLPVVITPSANSKVKGTMDPIPLTTYSAVPNPINTGGSLTSGTALGRVAGELIGNYNYTLGTLNYGPNYSLSLGGANQFSIYIPIPTANTATSLTTISFTANWSTVAGAKGYCIDLSTSNTFASFIAGYENKDIGNVTSFDIKDLTANSAYYYRVRAYDATETSANSNRITVFTLNTNPTSITATNIATTSFKANWLNSKPDIVLAPGGGSENIKAMQSDATAIIVGSYFLDVASDSNFVHMLTGYSNKNINTDLSCNVTGLSAGTTYYYRMRYSSATGNSNNSNTISVSTLEDVPVIANPGIKLKNYTVKQSELALTDSLTIRYAGASAIQMAVITISKNYIKSEDQLTFTNSNGLTGLWNSETGMLTITGSSNPIVYEAVFKTVKYRNTSLTPSALTKEISFTVNNKTYTSNIEKMEITISNSITDGNIAPVISNLETNSLAYLKDVTGLRIGLTVNLTVNDPDNLYLNSGSVKFTQGYIKNEDFIDCENTDNISGTFNIETGILTISGKETLTGYQNFLRKLYYRNSNTLNGITSQKSIEFVVNDGIVNSNTATRQLLVKSPLETPTELAGNMSNNKVQLSWKDNSSSEQGYIVERSEGNNTIYVVVARLNSNEVNYTDQNIVNGRRYYYRVAASNGTIKSDYSNEVSVLSVVVGISDLNGTPKSYIVSQNYPNPFNPSTVIVYGIPYESKVRIQIFNTLGQMVDDLANETRAAGFYIVRWDASRLPSGVYLYRVNAVSIDGKQQFNEIKRMVLVK